MKVINYNKLEKAKVLLQEGVSYARIREIIGKEFNESISPSTLAQLNKELKDQKSNPQNLSPEIKDSILILQNLFKASVTIPEFREKLTDREFTASELLEKVI